MFDMSLSGTFVFQRVSAHDPLLLRPKDRPVFFVTRSGQARECCFPYVRRPVGTIRGNGSVPRALRYGKPSWMRFACSTSIMSCVVSVAIRSSKRSFATVRI